ncbi:MAG: YsnF/AvaK domain-containing protein [Polyangiaceae bacterium]|nr:YsnF/AvaK domain-containing protein [Polyangiaceae bacterium]
MESRFKEQILTGFDVWSSDGEKLGKVVAVHADSFEVEKGFFFPKDYILSFEDVRELRGDEVHLSRTRKEIGVRGGTFGPMGEPEEHPYVGRTGGQYEGETLEQATTLQRSAEAGKVEEIRVPLHEEEVRTSKHTEQIGEVRVTKHVVTEQRQISVPVAHEVVTVERIPATGHVEATLGEGAFQEQTVTMPIREEMVDIEKRPVVREEIRISKATEEEQQPVSTTVRREVAEVEGGPADVTEGIPLRKTG